MASLRLDCVSNSSVMPVLPARLAVLVARSAASSPYSSWPNSSWHSENNATTGRRSGWVSAMLREQAYSKFQAWLAPRGGS